MTANYAIEYLGDKFITEFKLDQYAPTKEQLERFLFKWIFEHAGYLTINEVAIMMVYIESKVQTQDTKHKTIQLEIIE